MKNNASDIVWHRTLLCRALCRYLAQNTVRKKGGKHEPKRAK
jgi:hypothetical protein